MLIGYNNDVEYQARMYHIQTEDHGTKNGHITTTVFFSGQTLDSLRSSYIEAIKGITDTDEQNEIIKKMMIEQHRAFYKKLFDGNYNIDVERLINTDKSAKSTSLAQIGALPPVSAESVPEKPEKHESSESPQRRKLKSSRMSSKDYAKEMGIARQSGRNGQLSPNKLIPEDLFCDIRNNATLWGKALVSRPAIRNAKLSNDVRCFKGEHYRWDGSQLIDAVLNYVDDVERR